MYSNSFVNECTIIYFYNQNIMRLIFFLENLRFVKNTLSTEYSKYFKYYFVIKGKYFFLFTFMYEKNYILKNKSNLFKTQIFNAI